MFTSKGRHGCRLDKTQYAVYYLYYCEIKHKEYTKYYDNKVYPR